MCSWLASHSGGVAWQYSVCRQILEASGEIPTLVIGHRLIRRTSLALFMADFLRPPSFKLVTFGEHGFFGLKQTCQITCNPFEN